MTNESVYLINSILNHVFGVSVYTPRDLYLGLLSAPANQYFYQEISNVDYHRKRIYFNHSAASDGGIVSISNDGAIVFDAPTVLWQNIYGLGIFDDLGNILYQITLSEPIFPYSVVSGNTIPSQVVIDDSYVVISGIGSAESVYLTTSILNHVLGAGGNLIEGSGTISSIYTPGDIYLGLYGSGGNELSGNNYSRVLVSFGSSSGKKIVNSSVVGFPIPGSSWVIYGYGLWDSLNGGNLLYSINLIGGYTATSVNIPVGVIGIGDLN